MSVSFEGPDFRWCYLDGKKPEEATQAVESFSHIPTLGEVLLTKQWVDVLAEVNLWLLNTGISNESSPQGFNWTYRVAHSMYTDLGFQYSLEDVAGPFYEMKKLWNEILSQTPAVEKK